MPWRPAERGGGRPRSLKAALNAMDRHPRRRRASLIIAGRIPARGRRRLRWLGALERAITTDARRTVDRKVFEGWERADAADAYREWIGELVAAAALAKEHDG
jgi:hypothetical protein